MESDYLIDRYLMSPNDLEIFFKIENELYRIGIKAEKEQIMHSFNRLYYYKSKETENYVVNEIIKHYKKIPNWFIKKEEWIKLKRIKEIIK